MVYKIDTNILNLSIGNLKQRIHKQCERMTDPLFTFDRNGLRLAIAAIEDETNELYDEWQHHKRMPSNAVNEIRHELLDIAAVALITYTQTMEKNVGE